MAIAIFVSTAIAARAIQRAVRNDARFTVNGEFAGSQDSTDFSIQGLQYASRSRVAKIFAPDFGRNLFDLPVGERRRKLLAIDWIEDASVSRIWPNKVTVRVWERKPVAFVNLETGAGRSRSVRLALIDAHGVVLEQPEKFDSSFPVLNGVHESQPESERRDRVRHMLRLTQELGPQLADELSEIDVSVVDNLRITLETDGQVVELMIGNGNFRKRLDDFLTHYPEIHKKSPELKLFDLRLDDRITGKG
ncbi:MAG: cell division protein FtsQ/DivIB [Bryobacteraceae bacterium]